MTILTQANNNISICVYLLNIEEESRVEYISKNIIRFGYSAEEIIGGKIKFADIIHQPQKSQKNNYEHYLLNSHHSEYIQRFQIKTKAGEDVWVEDRSHAIFNKEGKLTHIQGIIIDINEQKKVEENEKAAQMQFQQASKLTSLGFLAASIAHEISTPLNLIKIFIDELEQLILTECNSSEKLLLIEKINDTNRKVTKIVKELCAFAHVDKGTLKKVDVNEVIQNTLNLFTSIIENKRITISFNPVPDFPGIIVDFDQLQQVFNNLLFNARDALENTHSNPSISINITYNTEYCEIIFADNGCGIEPENLHRIFEPYFTTKTKDIRGGLGLFISYSIIKSFRGIIKVHSIKNTGTTFTLQFPLSLQPDEQKNEYLSKNDKQIARSLLICNTSVSCAIIEWLANEIGVATDSVNNYIIAKERIVCTTYQFIIIDFTTPNSFNVRTIKTLRQLSSAKVIIISTCPLTCFTIEEQNIIKNYVASFITKPVSKESLLSAFGLMSPITESLQL